MKLSQILLVSVFLLSSCKLISTKPTTTTTTTGTSSRENIQLWATYYYVPTLNHSDSGVPLLDVNEKELPLKLAECDWCTAAVQGSVYIKKDEKVYLAHYAGRSEVRQYDCRECSRYKNYPGFDKTGKVRWAVDNEKVTGSTGLKLVAMKSIAVDPTIIPYKSVVFIPPSSLP